MYSPHPLIYHTADDNAQDAAQLDAGSAARKRYRLGPSAIRFTPLPPDPAAPGRPRLEATVVATLDARAVPVPDAVISFLLRVFAPVVYRSLTGACRRMFHPDGDGSGGKRQELSVLAERQGARRWLYEGQAAAVDAALAARGLPPQRHLLRGLGDCGVVDAAA